jgi:TatD DNase family protein
MLVDSHAHLDDLRFAGDRAAVLDRAWEAGVRRILTIGIGRGPEEMDCGIPIAEAYDWIWSSVGIHPHEAQLAEERHFARMRELALHPKVVAIGEAGLDYHYDHSPRETQRAVFRRQLEIAREAELPIVVHTREADEDTEAILREMRPANGVLHCFTSGARLADFALEIGFMISFSGVVTFKNAGALCAIACRVPSDRILVETDCPYLAPEPHRGKRNEPAFARNTAERLAALRGVTLESFAETTAGNFARLFALPKSA